MIVIIAGGNDPVARLCRQRWSSCGAALLSSSDLSLAGWLYSCTSPSASTVVIDGAVVNSTEITGVLTRASAIIPMHLPFVAADDREYAAAEMTALLVAWLSQIECPVLNRPTPVSLLGSSWRPEQWTQLAAQLGVPFYPVRRSIRRVADPSLQRQDAPATFRLTVVGDVVLGDAARPLRESALHLARAAGLELISFDFDSPERDGRFVAADPLPAAIQDDVADAILDYFLRRRPRLINSLH